MKKPACRIILVVRVLELMAHLSNFCPRGHTASCAASRKTGKEGKFCGHVNCESRIISFHQIAAWLLVRSIMPYIHKELWPFKSLCTFKDTHPLRFLSVLRQVGVSLQLLDRVAPHCNLPGCCNKHNSPLKLTQHVFKNTENQSTIPFTKRTTAMAYMSRNSLSLRGDSVSGLRYASFNMISTKLAVISTATGKRHLVLLDRNIFGGSLNHSKVK